MNNIRQQLTDAKADGGFYRKPIDPVALGGGLAPSYRWTVISEASRPWDHKAALLWHEETAKAYADVLREDGDRIGTLQYFNDGPVWLEVELIDA